MIILIVWASMSRRHSFTSSQMSTIHPPAILGPETAAPIPWAPCFRGVVGGFLGLCGGGWGQKCQYSFYWRRDFSHRWPGDSQRKSGQFARIDSHESVRKKRVFFIRFESFTRIASNLRFVVQKWSQTFLAMKHFEGEKM